MNKILNAFLDGAGKAILDVDGFSSEKEKKDYNVLRKDIDNSSIKDNDILDSIVLYLYNHGESIKYKEILKKLINARPNLRKS